MDLDRCPRCGGKWTGGEACPWCKFVPIGAGLANSAAKGKKKKKARKYVEPGSSRGFFTIVFLGLIGFGLYRYEPWKDDWEMVRGMFGQGRHHSLVGDWEVVKTVAVTKQPGIMARESVEKGSFKFTKAGAVQLDLLHSDTETTASGSYLIDGTLVSLRELRTSGDGGDQIPTAVNMSLAWTGNDDVIAIDKTEAIYLHRRKTNSALSTFMQVDMKAGGTLAGGKDSPELRGVMGDVKRSGGDPAGSN